MNTLTLCEPSTAASEIMDRLRACLPVRFRSLSPDTPIASLELDSLDRVEFLCALDAEFHVSLTIEEFASTKTPRELGALIQGKTHQPF